MEADVQGARRDRGRALGSKTTAYVAANVDATSQARPNDKPLPYRIPVIYEQVGAAWQIVALHFSVVT